MTARGLTFCDVNTFFGGTAGGVRTYHLAKMAWFASQQVHRYVLVHPGRACRVVREAPTVTRIEVYGKPVAPGYRLLADFGAVADIWRNWQPDVVEAGDPWVSGPISLLYREVGTIRGVLASFYHCDPVETYLEPWARHGPRASPTRQLVVRLASRAIREAQRMYDCTIATSRTMVRRLQALGVSRVLRAPFGVDPRFLGPRGTPVITPRRLLYVGRLSRDKGFDVLLRALPALLTSNGVSLTIVGRGPLDAHVASLRYPNVRYLGFIRTPDAMRQVFDAHDLLIAPGPFETFGLATLEALAAGLVVVGPDAGGTGELLREIGSPFVFRAGCPDDLARTVAKAIGGDCRGVVEDGTALAASYGTWGDAISRLCSLYEAVHAERWIR